MVGAAEDRDGVALGLGVNRVSDPLHVCVRQGHVVVLVCGRPPGRGAVPVLPGDGDVGVLVVPVAAGVAAPSLAGTCAGPDPALTDRLRDAAVVRGDKVADELVGVASVRWVVRQVDGEDNTLRVGSPVAAARVVPAPARTVGGVADRSVAAAISKRV